MYFLTLNRQRYLEHYLLYFKDERTTPLTGTEGKISIPFLYKKQDDNIHK